MVVGSGGGCLELREGHEVMSYSDRYSGDRRSMGGELRLG